MNSSLFVLQIIKTALMTSFVIILPIIFIFKFFSENYMNIRLQISKESNYFIIYMNRL